jgi:hypothetical protein
MNNLNGSSGDYLKIDNLDSIGIGEIEEELKVV